jgi:hypothetical protein
VEVDSVIGAFMLIRRSVWDRVGGLDTRYFFFLEETDFCLQVQRAGSKIFHLPQVRVWHEQGGSAKQVRAAARIEYWRSRYLYFQKNHGAATQVVLGLGLGVRLSVNWVASLLLVVLTLGLAARQRNTCAVNSALWYWHLCGRPVKMGIPRD